MTAKSNSAKCDFKNRKLMIGQYKLARPGGEVYFCRDAHSYMCLGRHKVLNMNLGTLYERSLTPRLHALSERRQDSGRCRCFRLPGKRSKIEAEEMLKAIVAVYDHLAIAVLSIQRWRQMARI
jgi:hypothetical protein